MIGAGDFAESGLNGKIGEPLAGQISGRSAEDEITTYRSLGVAEKDLASAHHVLTRAQAEGRGQQVQF